MFKNYFYLRRSVYELNSILIGAKIIDIYSQEKNILFLSIPSVEFPNRHLLISANPQSPFLIIKKVHNKAKKNVYNIFNDIIPTKIKSIEISENDRLIKIELNDGGLYLKVMGNKTNIYLKSKNKKLEYFKKTAELKAKEFKNHSFSSTSEIVNLNEDKGPYNSISDLKINYPMISSEIKNELSLREDDLFDQNILTIFKDLVKEIFTSKIC